jgi:hypothetical protein
MIGSWTTSAWFAPLPTPPRRRIETGLERWEAPPPPKPEDDR